MPFQVGIVFLSILCHIWKIVPDLYEAITRIQASESIKNATAAASAVTPASVAEINETAGLNCSRPKNFEEEVSLELLWLFCSSSLPLACT